jgi:predicted DNA-binding protein with PD1-like motif
MKHKAVRNGGAARVFVLIFDIGDDVLSELQNFAEAQHIFAATLLGIGGFQRATVAYYNMEPQRYEPISVDEQVEVISFTGNIAEYERKPKIHAHVLLGYRDGHTAGGHLLSAVVRPTLELTLQELSVSLQRRDRPDIGIPLIDL